MATTNQIAWMRNVEERRHNLAYELENRRHNMQSEILSLYDTNTKAETSRYQSDMNYAGTKYSADSHYNSSIYSADKGFQGTKYSADTHLLGTKYSADTSAAASKYSADMNYAGTVYSANKHYAGTVYSADRGYDSSVLVNTGRVEAAKISADASKYAADVKYRTDSRNADINEAWNKTQANYKHIDALIDAIHLNQDKVESMARSFNNYTSGAEHISGAFSKSMNALSSIAGLMNGALNNGTYAFSLI